MFCPKSPDFPGFFFFQFLDFPVFFSCKRNAREADSYAVLFFFDSIWAFYPIADVSRPQSHGVGRAILGMSLRILSERYPAQKSVSSPAQFEFLSTSQINIDRLIFRRGTISDYFSSDYAP